MFKQKKLIKSILILVEFVIYLFLLVSMYIDIFLIFFLSNLPLNSHKIINVNIKIHIYLCIHIYIISNKSSNNLTHNTYIYMLRKK